MTKELTMTADGLEIITNEGELNYDHLKAAQEELLARRKHKLLADRIEGDIITLNRFVNLPEFNTDRFKRIYMFWTYLDDRERGDHTQIWEYLELFNKLPWEEIAPEDIHVIMKLISFTLDGEALFDPITCQFYHKDSPTPSSVIPDDEPVKKPLLIRILSFFNRK